MLGGLKKPFSLYRRTLKSGKKVYYARYRLPDGSMTPGRSTGQISKRSAEAVAYATLKEGLPVRSKYQYIKYFAKDFFSWEGEWAVSKRSAGKRISPEQCTTKNLQVENHIIRVLGGLFIEKIDSETVRYFRNRLYSEGLSSSSVNKILGCLSDILKAAVEKKLLSNMPVIERVAASQNDRGILTHDEVKSLFTQEWPDFRGYVANLCAAATGCRLSEILGMRFCDLEPGYIHIKGVWVTQTGRWRPGLKNGRKTRRVPVPPGVEGKLHDLQERNPYPPTPERFLFYSEFNSDRPMVDRLATSEGLYKALAMIGIDEQTRKARNLSFHGWRHFFNSLLIESRVPLVKIQALTGHLSATMTENYYHPGEMDDVRLIVEKVVDFPGAGEKTG